MLPEGFDKLKNFNFTYIYIYIYIYIYMHTQTSLFLSGQRNEPPCDHAGSISSYSGVLGSQLHGYRLY
jgi:hypothetical protein